MTPQHQRFVNAKLAGENNTQAAKTAGFSERSARNQGQRMMHNDVVTQEIADQQAQAALSASLDAEYVLSELMDTYRAARDDKAYGAAIQALTALGRHLQLFTDRLDVRLVREQAEIAAKAEGLDAEQVFADAMKLLTASKGAK